MLKNPGRLLYLIFVLSPRYVTTELGYFWHVTDFHYDPTYWTSQLSCFKKVPRPGSFGEPTCDPPWRLVLDTVQNMAAIKPDVDFILWTGDSVAHLEDYDTSVTVNMEILKNVTLLLNQSFPSSVRFYPTLGNHDFYPRNQADVLKDAVYSRTWDIWKHWIDDSDQLETFLRGGFYHKLVQPRLRLLALNTNLYYTNNKITKDIVDPAGQFQWIDEVLAQAKAIGEKVIVTGHVPPGVKTPKMKDLVYSHHEDRLVDVLTKYSDVIVSSHYGHAHADGFKLLQQTPHAGNAIPQFIAPSVTPYQTRNMEKLTGAPHNPAVRLVEYDRETGKHFNYVQYFVNLTDANNHMSKWTPLYNFTESYGVADMSVASLRDIFSRMEKKGGETLAQRYCNFYFVTNRKMPCPPRSRWGIVCGGRFYKLEEAIKCIDMHLEILKEREHIHILVTQDIVFLVIVSVGYFSFFIFCQKISRGYLSSFK